LHSDIFVLSDNFDPDLMEIANLELPEPNVKKTRGRPKKKNKKV